jgi:uncharacterized protein (UPF0332 family)
MMPYRDLETVGWIVREEIAPEEVRSAFERAVRELAAAEEIVGKYPESSFELAYHAMMFAVTALLYAEGYRARAERHHRTLVEFAEAALGESQQSLVNAFDRTRRRRHRAIYGHQGASRREAQDALTIAHELIDLVQRRLQTKGLLDESR